jgi:hypothetical protein
MNTQPLSVRKFFFPVFTSDVSVGTGTEPEM